MKKQLIITMLAAGMLVGGCAPKSWDAESEGAYDIFEPFNRHIYKFNKGIDWLILHPTAVLYSGTPQIMQDTIGNVVNNVKEPANIVNNLLQKKGDATVNSVARVTFNTTIGLGGMIDVATLMGVEEQKADFGQTLRAYGLNNTTYIVLPLLGPSTVGDTVGTAADNQLSPVTYIDDNGTRVVVYGVTAVHRRRELLETTELLEGAGLDEYSFIRDIYDEHRRTNVPTEVWEF